MPAASAVLLAPWPFQVKFCVPEDIAPRSTVATTLPEELLIVSPTSLAADDFGNLHKFQPVFNGVPAEVTSSGWPVALHMESITSSPVYDPGSSFADENGYVQMPNVNPMDEMVNMISAQQDYQANLEAFNVAKTLAMRTLTI